MSTLLRQSGRLARLSNSSLRGVSRSRIRNSQCRPAVASCLYAQRSRSYATDPKKPKIDQSKKVDGRKIEGQNATEPPSKHAPGAENGSKAPLSPNPTPAGKEKETP